jgi:hypothetical protein
MMVSFVVSLWVSSSARTFWNIERIALAITESIDDGSREAPLFAYPLHQWFCFAPIFFQILFSGYD